MRKYIETVNAMPMTRGQYKNLRGWPLSADENGNEDGYFVEYINTDKANTPGYVSWSPKYAFERTYSIADSPENTENISDGYHTFKELYRYRLLYNAAFFNALAKEGKIKVCKSHKHNDGEDCFGGGWFIVMAELPTGQISNHYEDEDWDLFNVPKLDTTWKWDGHTPNEAADRLEEFLKMKNKYWNDYDLKNFKEWLTPDGISFFKHLYGLTGSVAPILKLNRERKGMPTHPVHFREGLRVRNWMRSNMSGISCIESGELDEIYIDFIKEAIK